jgi:hypothetical protein
MLTRGDGWAAEGVDARVNSMEAAGARTPANRVVAEAGANELGEGDLVVLCLGNFGDPGLPGLPIRRVV